MNTVSCPVGYNCTKLLEPLDILALFGGVALVLLAFAFALWLLTR